MDAKEMYVEWQRRVQLISPDLVADNKPTSDVAFSFLNGAQDRFVAINYVGDDQTLTDTNTFAKNVDAIKSLIVQEELQPAGVTPQGFSLFELPTDPNKEYMLYVSSVSMVTGTYKQHTGPIAITNQLVKYKDLDSYTKTAFNNPIIRIPAVGFMSNADTKVTYLAVATDVFTALNGIILTYYRKPLRFNTIPGENVIDKCELPESEHSTIVDMAVEMFITEAKYRLQTKQSSNNAEG